MSISTHSSSAMALMPAGSIVFKVANLPAGLFAKPGDGNFAQMLAPVYSGRPVPDSSVDKGPRRCPPRALPVAEVAFAALTDASMLELTFCMLDAEIVFDALTDTSMLELTFCKLDADDLVRFWPTHGNGLSTTKISTAQRRNKVPPEGFIFIRSHSFRYGVWGDVVGATSVGRFTKFRIGQLISHLLFVLILLELASRGLDADL